MLDMGIEFKCISTGNRGNSSSIVEDGNDLPGIADRDLTTNTDMF